MIHRLAALLTASAILVAAAAAASAQTVPADPAPLLLRLPDLGPGYIITSRVRSCEALRPSMPVLRRAIGTGPYRGCLLSFRRAWTPPGRSPGPGVVYTLAVAFDSPEGATTALSHPRRLPALLYHDRRHLRVVEPAPAIGDQAVLLRMNRTILGFRLSASIVLWRSGSVLGMAIASSLDGDGDAHVQTALRLATLQQARIANSTPLRRPVNDDRFVLLDDPTLGATVMWLGEHLPAQGRLPALNLSATDETTGFLTPPQLLMQLIYRTPLLRHSTQVALWRPRGLHRLLRRPIPPYLCRRRFDVDVPGAHAWIVATLHREPQRASGRCPHGGASLTAVAFFDDVAVTIDAGSGSHLNSYGSRAGLRTLLRALRPRPIS